MTSAREAAYILGHMLSTSQVMSYLTAPGLDVEEGGDRLGIFDNPVYDRFKRMALPDQRDVARFMFDLRLPRPVGEFPTREHLAALYSVIGDVISVVEKVRAVYAEYGR